LDFAVKRKRNKIKITGTTHRHTHTHTTLIPTHRHSVKDTGNVMPFIIEIFH